MLIRNYILSPFAFTVTSINPYIKRRDLELKLSLALNTSGYSCGWMDKSLLAASKTL